MYSMSSMCLSFSSVPTLEASCAKLYYQVSARQKGGGTHRFLRQDKPSLLYPEWFHMRFGMRHLENHKIKTNIFLIAENCTKTLVLARWNLKFNDYIHRTSHSWQSISLAGHAGYLSIRTFHAQSRATSTSTLGILFFLRPKNVLRKSFIQKCSGDVLEFSGFQVLNTSGPHHATTPHISLSKGLQLHPKDKSETSDSGHQFFVMTWSSYLRKSDFWAPCWAR